MVLVDFRLRKAKKDDAASSKRVNLVNNYYKCYGCVSQMGGGSFIKESTDGDRISFGRLTFGVKMKTMNNIVASNVFCFLQ